MVYSTFPSSCSTMSSCSGRSTPDNQPLRQPSNQSGIITRRASFLTSFFLGPSNTPSQQQQQQPQQQSQQHQPHSQTLTLPHQSLPPRRTSFGTAFGTGGKLSALSALGLLPSSAGSPSSGSHLPYLTHTSQRGSTTSFHGDSPLNEDVPVTSNTQTFKPPKKHLCFPDGMGGTMCVEIKDRKRRGSS